MGKEPPEIQVDIVETPAAAVEADVLAFPVFDPAAAAELTAIDEELAGRLERLIADGEARGKLGETAVLHTDGEIAARRIAAVGIGEAASFDADALRTAAARVAATATGIGEGTVAWTISKSLPLDPVDQARAIVDGTLLGSYQPGRWKTSKERGDLSRLLLVAKDARPLLAAGDRASVVARWANRCRDLVNAPANELTPSRLAETAIGLAEAYDHLSYESLARDEIVAAGMGAFAAVAQGSDTEPRLIVLEYVPPAARRDLVLGLVGKAITFDTGGISLKPARGMESMKGDMSGGGAVIAATCAIADLQLPVRTLTVVASTENMPSGHAYRPGDILTAANGKTIEVTNTDAEGRLVLADALWYAREHGATHVMDLATLTGAMVVALGDLYAGFFANDDGWADAISAAGEASGDHIWRFPLHPRYRRYVKSSFADMKNSSDLREAGPVLAAEFLKEFAGEGPWAHLDIAGPAFLERSRGDYLWQPGGSGYGVRLIAELASRLAA